VSEVAAEEFSEETSLPHFGAVLRSKVQQCLWWLVSGLIAIFLTNAFLDVGVILALPLLAIILLIWWLILGIGCFSTGWGHRHQGRTAILVVLAPIAALAVLALLLVPTGKLGAYTQAAATLLFKRTSCERVMIQPNVPNAELRANWAQTGGHGGSAIWSFGYGGFLSMERDIVYDPLGRPEERAVKLLGAQTASCQALWSHYYDCMLDY